MLPPESLIAALRLNGNVLLKDFHVPGKDRIVIGRLQGGGGILTYVKNPPSPTEVGPVFVHTLNTESGLIRKVEAMHVPLSVIFNAESHRSEAEAFSVIVHILTYLQDKEKNNSAYALVRALLHR